jgi:hypothetical protein
VPLTETEECLSSSCLDSHFTASLRMAFPLSLTLQPPKQLYQKPNQKKHTHLPHDLSITSKIPKKLGPQDILAGNKKESGWQIPEILFKTLYLVILFIFLCDILAWKKKRTPPMIPISTFFSWFISNGVSFLPWNICIGAGEQRAGISGAFCFVYMEYGNVDMKSCGLFLI